MNIADGHQMYVVSFCKQSKIKSLTLSDITKIENLPPFLHTFICSINGVQKIENLPHLLRELTCQCNHITKIENLPNRLEIFNCSSNGIQKIENLPNSLRQFDCHNNFFISKIENLPKLLQKFDCRYTDIIHIENLPCTLQTFDYTDNKIKFIDNIPKNEYIEMFGNFDLQKYHKMKKSAKIICNGCYNWVWKPKCRDGKIGIRLKLDLKFVDECVK